MATSPQEHHYTLEEYYAIEQETGCKHEYDHGRIYAMTGGSPRHAYLASIMGFRLNQHLYGSPCRVYNSDAKVHITQDCSLYPDVVVSCNVADYHQQELQSPRVVVEVLSPSTESRDRGRKFTLYQTLISLQEYVLVSCDIQRIEVFRRQGTTWKSVVYGPEDIVQLLSIDVDIPMQEIYEHA